jgi:hypothetical protein
MGRRISARRTHRIGNLSAPTRTVSLASKQTIGHCTVDTSRSTSHLHRQRIDQLEVVEAGVVRASDGAYTEYPDPRRDYWQRAVVPALKQISLKAWRDTGKSAVILIDARRGRRRPHAKHRALLIMYARRRGLLS